MILRKDKLALSSRNILLNKKELIIAKKISKNMISFKKKLFKKKNIKKLLSLKKNELNKIHNIKIEYLELRSIINLKITNSGSINGIKTNKNWSAYNYIWTRKYIY